MTKLVYDKYRTTIFYCTVKKVNKKTNKKTAQLINQCFYAANYYINK